MEQKPKDEKLIKKRIPEEKRFIKLGDANVDLGALCRDPRDAIDDLREAIEEDWALVRYSEWDTKLHPFAEASELVTADRFPLDIYPPLYTNPQHICHDCFSGPCDLKQGKGKCGLGFEAYQGRLSLRLACKGARAQVMEARELLECAIKEFGREQEVSYGERHDIADHALCIGQLTGKYATTVGGLERVMEYVESQLNKLTLAGYSGVGEAFDFECMAFHVGSVLLAAQEVSELLKVSCFGLQNSAQHDKLEMQTWPPVNILGGLKNVDRNKPVIAFVGDNFLPAWTTVNYLKENNLTEELEICGIGSVGLDLTRYYDRVRIIASTASAPRAIRLAFADVIVASVGCMNLDLLELAKKGGSKLIWVSTQPIGIEWVRDRTDDPIDALADDLTKKVDAIWCRDMDKVGEIAVRVAREVKKKRKAWEDYLIGEAEAKKEAERCREDCDLCFNACPYGLAIGQALRKVKKEGLAAMEDVEKKCVLCQRCEDVCPENIRITDIMVRVSSKWAYEENFKMRSGRGTIPEDETARAAFTLSNSAGFVRILSCGGSKQITEDVAWFARECTSRACVVVVAGCGGAEVARYFDEEEQKFLYEKYAGEYVPRNVIFTGSCSTHCLLQDASAHWARTGVHISHYANLVEVADVTYRLFSTPAILWGESPERMYSVASAFARFGERVIVGPVSSFQWKRFLLGNQYDRSKWRVWDTADGREVETEPAEEQLIIPVETKEEAIVMLWNLGFRPGGISMFQILRFTPYLEQHMQFFGELPDNWHWYVHSNADLPIKSRAKLLKILREEHGWETDYARVFKAKHRDGRLLDIWTFNREYGVGESRYYTHAPELLSKKGKQLLSEERKKKLREEGYKI
jgi:acetyl-CoA decarbonylase/synthase complex subunit alpha